jgi:hypothetical protein
MPYARKIQVTLGAIVVALAGLIATLAASQTARQVWNDSNNLLAGALTPDQFSRITAFARSKIRGNLDRINAHQPVHDDLMDQLRLTSEQLDEVMAIINVNLNRIQTAGQPIFADEKDIHAALLENPPSPVILRDDADQLARDLGDLALVISDVAHQVRGVLTPSQNDALDRLLALQAQIEQENADRLPADTDQALALWKDLDLRPVQIQRLFGLTRAWVAMSDGWCDLHRAVVDAQLTYNLSPEQMRVLHDFRAEHDPPIKAREQEGVDQFMTLSYVGLTSDQMDRLVEVLEARLPDIYLSVDSAVDGGQALRYQVMARDPDPDAIRATAVSLSGMIGDSLVLEGQMIDEARDILSERQFDLVNNYATFLEDQVHAAFTRLPDDFADLTELRAKLNLTDEQREAWRNIGIQQRNDLQRQWRIIAEGG